MGIFILVVDRDLLKRTHSWRQIHVRSRQQTCFSLLMPRKSFNKSFEFLLYKTNRLNFSVFVCTVIDHRWRHSVFCHTRENVIYMLNKTLTTPSKSTLHQGASIVVVCVQESLLKTGSLFPSTARWAYALSWSELWLAGLPFAKLIRVVAVDNKKKIAIISIKSKTHERNKIS